MQLVIFDLDGTLTQTTSVDAECYVRALADEAGIERINTRWSDYVHVTDSGITEQIFLEHRGRAPTPDELARLQRRFVTLLEAAFVRVRANGRDAVLRNKGASPVVRDFTDFGTFLEALEQAHVPNARGV